MTSDFSVKLTERVVTTFVFAFLAAWLVGLGATPTLAQIGDLSLAQKAAAAGGAAVIQLLLSVFVAPHIGDPNSPALLPKRLIKKIAPVAKAPTVVVTLDDIIAATLKRLGTSPTVTVATEDIANDLFEQGVDPNRSI